MARRRPLRTAGFLLLISVAIIFFVVAGWTAIVEGEFIRDLDTRHRLIATAVVIVGTIFGCLFYYLAEHVRRVIHKPGRCAECGYDLRSTPDQNGPSLHVCPECGTPSR